MSLNSGPVHTYPDIFENASFSKRFASTRGAFSKISPSTRRRCYIQTSQFELRQKKTDNQNALLLSPKMRAHALIRRKSMPWRQRFRKAPFSPVHTTTWKRRFQKDPLWRAFSKRFVFGDRKRRLRVDANPKRIKKVAFSKISGYVWTGPQILLQLKGLLGIGQNVNWILVDFGWRLRKHALEMHSEKDRNHFRLRSHEAGTIWNDEKCEGNKIWASVHTMPEQFENDEKCDGCKIWASVHTMPEQFENDEKCDGCKIWASVHTMPEQFENDEKCEGSKIWASVHTMPEQFENGGNLTVKNSLQDFDGREIYLHPKNRSVSFQERRRMFCFHHFQVFTECRFQNEPVRVLFSKSTVFEIFRQIKCRFRVNGRPSVTFFTVFKMCRHRVGAVLDLIWYFAGAFHNILTNVTIETTSLDIIWKRFFTEVGLENALPTSTTFEL